MSDYLCARGWVFHLSLLLPPNRPWNLVHFKVLRWPWGLSRAWLPAISPSLPPPHRVTDTSLRPHWSLCCSCRSAASHTLFPPPGTPSPSPSFLGSRLVPQSGTSSSFPFGSSKWAGHGSVSLPDLALRWRNVLPSSPLLGCHPLKAIRVSSTSASCLRKGRYIPQTYATSWDLVGTGFRVGKAFCGAGGGAWRNQNYTKEVTT